MTSVAGRTRVQRARNIRTAAECGLLLVFAVGLFAASGFSSVAGWFPMVVCAIGIVLTLPGPVGRALPFTRARVVDVALPDAEDPEAEAPHVRRAGVVVWILLVAALLTLTWLVGLVWAAPVWLGTVLTTVSRLRWYWAGVAGVGVYFLLWSADVYLRVDFPSSLFDLSGVGF